MARRSAQVRREEILDAVVVEVTARGFARTRVADVASSLAISTALVFYHFGTKEKLFADALEYAVAKDLARLDNAVVKASGPADAVRRMLALWSPQGSAEGWTLWVDAWSEAQREPEMRTVMRTLDTRWRELLAEQVRLGVEAGVFADVDAQAVAWRLSALLDGLSVQVLVHRSLTRTQMARWLREATAYELGVDVAQLG